MTKPTGRPRGRPPGGGRPRGRPRRTSNSTVASIDLSNVKYVPEAIVLEKATANDPDEWPCFVLRDAVVYRKTADGRLEIANVCNVDLDGPFIVRGRLEVDMEEHRDLLLNVAYSSAYIEIPANITYSIGFGPWPAVWVAGQAGWFEILPAPEYEAMYNTVCEGITLYYLVMDAHLEARGRAGKGKRGKAVQIPVDKLLFKYAVAVGDGVTLPEAKERCQEHARFLLAHFSKELEFKWSTTTFMKWLTGENEELVKKLVEAAAKRPAPPEPSAKQPDLQSNIVKTKTEPQDDSDGLPSLSELRTSPTESDRSRRSKSRASRQSQDIDVEMSDVKPPQPPKRETPIYPPRPGEVPSVPGTRPHDARPALPKRETPIHPPRPSQLLSAPGAKPYVPMAPTPTPPTETDDRATASIQDPIQFLKELLEEIFVEEAHGDLVKLTHSWVHTKMYLKCSMAYAVPKEVTHFYAAKLVPSLDPKWYNTKFFLWLKDVKNRPWQPEILTPERVPLQLVRRKKMGPRKTPSHASSTPRPGQGAGKTFPSTPRPSPALRPGPSAKRPIFYDGNDDDGRPLKYARTEHDSDSDVEEDSDEQELDDSSNDAAVAPGLATPLPAVPKESVKIVIRADKIPEMSPSGPNGAWKCEEKGCNYIVRSAEDPEGKQLLGRHFEDHADRVQKMNLALAEGTRGHQPINHLLEKIRSLGEAAQKRNHTGPDGTQFPEPIKRRMLI